MALAEETARDENGRFVPSVQADGKVSIDTLPMDQFVAAREAGATSTIVKSELEEAPKITGKESQQEYEAKRDEQQGRNKGAGFQKKIDRLVKEKYQEREQREALERRVQELEGKNGNAASEPNGDSTSAEPQSQESESYSAQPEQKREVPEPKIAALRQQFPDFDAVMHRAKTQNLRISDDAAEAMHGSEHAGEMAYLLASNDELRDALNKEPPELHVERIRELNQRIDHIKSGRWALKEKLEASFSPEEISKILEAEKNNELGGEIVYGLARELNELPNGHEVVKFLMLNPVQTKRFERMSESRAIAELGRISERLEGRNGGFVSKAGPPIRPVSGGSTKSSVPLDQMDMDSYNKARDAGRTR